MSAILSREQRGKPLPRNEAVSPIQKNLSAPAQQTTRSPFPVPHSTPRTSAIPVGRGEVFSINFIRHETLPRQVRRALVFVGLGYLCLNLTVMCGLIGASMYSRGEWGTLQSQVQGQMPSKDVLSALKQNMKTLHERAAQDLATLNVITALQQQRFVVGGKLSALTKTLPARTWITDLSGTREERSIKIQAAYLVDPDRPYELPTKRWIGALKADSAFSQGLKRLDLGATSRKTQGKAELFLFELTAEWKR